MSATAVCSACGRPKLSEEDHAAGLRDPQKCADFDPPACWMGNGPAILERERMATAAMERRAEAAERDWRATVDERDAFSDRIDALNQRHEEDEAYRQRAEAELASAREELAALRDTIDSADRIERSLGAAPSIDARAIVEHCFGPNAPRIVRNTSAADPSPPIALSPAGERAIAVLATMADAPIQPSLTTADLHDPGVHR